MSHADRQADMAKLTVANRTCFATEAKNLWGRTSTVPNDFMAHRSLVSSLGPSSLLGSLCHDVMFHVTGCVNTGSDCFHRRTRQTLRMTLHSVSQ